MRQVAGALTPPGLVIRSTTGRFISRRTPARGRSAMIKRFTFLYSLCMPACCRGIGLAHHAIHNSVPSRGPLTPANPWMSRLKWRIGATAFWSFSEALYKVTGGRMVWAPSFELIARRSEGLS
jgi:hypothetical protein